MAREVLSHLAHLGPKWWEKEGKREKERKGRGKREFRERHTTFFLNFSTIRLAVPGGARGKVLPRDKSYKWKPELGVLEKLQEVGVSRSPTRFTSCLRSI